MTVNALNSRTYIINATELMGTISQLPAGSIGIAQIPFTPADGATQILVLPRYATWGCIVDLSVNENVITASVVNIGSSTRNITVAVMVLQLGKS